MPALLEIVKKNISVPRKTISGYLSISSLEPDGVDSIRKALTEAEKSSGKAEIEISYSGSGKHLIKATAQDYKSAEKELNMLSEKVISYMKKNKGNASFERI